jgi:hypothetical protein
MRILQLIIDSRFESGQGSRSGRNVFASKEGASRERVKARKSRVRVFPSISKALGVLDFGTIFSTTASDRLYVVTRPTWGKKSVQQSEKVAKGFSAGTPFSEIKGYSVRTMKKHGKQRSKKFLKYKEHK